MSLEPSELDYLTSRLGRMPRPAELHIVAAEWSEHCSYKSSKRHLRMLPTDGPLVVSEKGYDSGVLDVGDGYVVTAHIESHNHPSAVEPYGGAATGVGGVVRDILSAGTRPVAILDGLRFGSPRTDPKALWLFKNAVTGIADYGNCIGIPTVGGELEFDDSYAGYAMVDVAAVGFGRRDRLVRNHAEPGDVVVLLGGPTGRDGIGGSQFASDSLETEDRSAVQIPDPFVEKLLIEAVLEARSAGAIHAMKDLGGGGLSCAISETADALGVGITINADAVHAREGGMSVEEVMTSESQERMLIITDGGRGLQAIRDICSKFGVSHSVIGVVKHDGMMRVTSERGRKGGGGGEEDVAAEMPAAVVANARLLDLPHRRPAYLDGIEDVSCAPHAQGGGGAADYTDVLHRLMTSPNIASRSWVYSQYDHEVGIRTVVRPGADASVLRLDNGRYLAISMDGNPKHCYVNPRQGAIGCFEEACRNVVCTGAAPIGMLDHLQFGDPTDPGVFWTFVESVRGISDFAREMGIPCVGGKVSLYNETPSGPIKPTPVIAVLGLISGDGGGGGAGSGDKRAGNSAMQRMRAKPEDGDHVIVVGSTKNEMGGSEYYEYIRGVVGGRCPAVSAAESRRNSGAILEITGRAGLSHMVHDCSKGGLAAAVSEVCLGAGLGCDVDISRVPRAHDGGTAAAGAPPRAMPDDVTLFSESHSRYVVLVPDESLQEVEGLLARSGAAHARIGRITGGGPRGRIIFRSGGSNSRTIADLSVDKTRREWSGVLGGMVHGA